MDESVPVPAVSALSYRSDDDVIDDPPALRRLGLFVYLVGAGLVVGQFGNPWDGIRQALDSAAGYDGVGRIYAYAIAALQILEAVGLAALCFAGRRCWVAPTRNAGRALVAVAGVVALAACVREGTGAAMTLAGAWGWTANPGFGPSAGPVGAATLALRLFLLSSTLPLIVLVSRSKRARVPDGYRWLSRALVIGVFAYGAA